MSDFDKGMAQSKERAGSAYNGYGMLIALLAIVAFCVAFFATGLGPTLGPAIGLPILILSALSFILIAIGFFMVQPNQAVVITLFGEYRGTVRTEGLQWIWPWMGKKKLSVRAHNIHSDKVKINDLRGNPIEVACNVVWRVAD
ncbi:MAG: SPFH domain-containing protein, partial [Pseudomonadota bacterium]